VARAAAGGLPARVDDLVEHDDPFQRHLLADLIDLRDRLRAELDQGGRG